MKRYNPISYHNGTIWPHDNSIIALGLSRYDLREELSRLIKDQIDASTSFDNRLPELFCGYMRSENPTPVNYPLSNSPQAWASASVFAYIEAITGFEPHVPEGHFKIRKWLPNWLSYIDIKNLNVGRGKLSFRISRSKTKYRIKIYKNTAKLKAKIVE